MFRKIFEKDPKKRIKVTEIKKHPWLSEMNEDHLFDDIDKTFKKIDVDDTDILNEEKTQKSRKRSKTIGRIGESPAKEVAKIPSTPPKDIEKRKFPIPHVKEEKLKESDFQNSAVVLTDGHNDNEVMDLWEFLDKSKPIAKEEKRNSKEWKSFLKIFNFGSSKNEIRTFKPPEIQSPPSVQPSPMNSLMKKEEPLKMEKFSSFKKIEKVEKVEKYEKLEKKESSKLKGILSPSGKSEEEDDDKIEDWMDFLKSGSVTSKKKESSKSSNSSNSPRKDSPKGSPKGSPKSSPLWSTQKKDEYGNTSPKTLSPKTKTFIKVTEEKTSPHKFVIVKKSPRYEDPDDSPKSDSENPSISKMFSVLKKSKDSNGNN